MKNKWLLSAVAVSTLLLVPAIGYAQDKGADAIIAMRYDATEFAQGITEVLAYGTAVKIAPAE